jgi:hypothetical protein
MRLILLIGLLLQTICLTAQLSDFTTITRHKYTYELNPLRITVDSNGVNVLEQNFEEHRHTIYRYDLSGQVQFKVGWYDVLNNPQIQFRDGNIYMLGYPVDCDVVLGLTFYHVNNTTGQTTWTHSPGFSSAPSFVPYHFIPASGGNWWIWSAFRSPRRINGTTGAYMDSLTVLRPAIDNYVLLPNGHTLTYGENGLQVYNGDFELLASALTDQEIREVALLDGQIAAYGAGALWLMDQDLTNIEVTDVSTTIGTGRVQMAVRDDHIFLGLFESNNARWYEFNQNLNLVQAGFFPDQANLRPLGFAIQNEHWLIGGSNLGYLQVLKSQSIPYPAYQHQLDIELTEVVLPDSIRAAIGPWSTVYRADSIQLTVRNNSLHTINRFRLNSTHSFDSFWCVYYYEQQRYITNTPIEPGTERTIVWPIIEWTNLPFTPPTPVLTAQMLFFWVDMPQDSLDAQRYNNLIVGTFPVGTPVSTNTLIAPKNVQITPNPAFDAATITCEESTWSLTVFDELGRTIHTATPATDTYRLERHGLPVGVYTIRIQAGERAGVYRIVWQ